MATDNKQPLTDDPVASSPCRHLRSKGMYITGCVDPVAEGADVGDGHCWCNLTQHSLGPDDNFAERALCTPQRTCFVAIL